MREVPRHFSQAAHSWYNSVITHTVSALCQDIECQQHKILSFLQHNIICFIRTMVSWPLCTVHGILSLNRQFHSPASRNCPILCHRTDSRGDDSSNQLDQDTSDSWYPHCSWDCRSSSAWVCLSSRTGGLWMWTCPRTCISCLWLSGFLSHDTGDYESSLSIPHDHESFWPPV